MKQATRAGILACSACLLQLACRDSGGGNGETPGTSNVELVGERAGQMVWRPVPGASSYWMEILDSTGSSTWTLNTKDTVGQLPSSYQSAPGNTWWVRAFDDSRQIASSTKDRMY